MANWNESSVFSSTLKRGKASLSFVKQQNLYRLKLFCRNTKERKKKKKSQSLIKALTKFLGEGKRALDCPPRSRLNLILASKLGTYKYCTIHSKSCRPLQATHFRTYLANNHATPQKVTKKDSNTNSFVLCIFCTL